MWHGACRFGPRGKPVVEMQSRVSAGLTYLTTPMMGGGGCLSRHLSELCAFWDVKQSAHVLSAGFSASSGVCPVRRWRRASCHAPVEAVGAGSGVRRCCNLVRARSVTNLLIFLAVRSWKAAMSWLHAPLAAVISSCSVQRLSMTVKATVS